MKKEDIVKRLLENKSKCLPRSAFGTDNHRCLDVMIEVIEEDLDEDEIYDRYENPDDEDDRDELESALDARGLLDGQAELEDLLYPED